MAFVAAIHFDLSQQNNIQVIVSGKGQICSLWVGKRPGGVH